MAGDFLAPMEGRLVDLADVPDPVFAGRIMGDGFAVDPSDGLVVSPVSGRITSLMADTRHAVGITASDGMEVLIHIGIDTVNLAGLGFTALVAQDDTVSAGQPLLRADLDLIRPLVPALLSPVVFTNLAPGTAVKTDAGRPVKRGDTDFIRFE